MARKAVIAIVLLVIAPRLLAQAPEPIRYTLRFAAPQTHYVEVEAAYPTGRQPAIELFMAVWTPGSYLIREYERHVEDVTATAAGRPLAVEKSRQNRWRVTTNGADTVTVRYRVYGREMTVRNHRKHTLVFEGTPDLVDADRAAGDVQKIVVAAKAVMGPLLYPHYHTHRLLRDDERSRGRGLEAVLHEGRRKD